MENMHKIKVISENPSYHFTSILIVGILIVLFLYWIFHHTATIVIKILSCFVLFFAVYDIFTLYKMNSNMCIVSALTFQAS